MKKLILILLFALPLLGQISDKPYQLTKVKYIDGIEPCTYAIVHYPLNDSVVVGCYGIMDTTFIPLYDNATINIKDLINYMPEVSDAR